MSDNFNIIFGKLNVIFGKHLHLPEAFQKKT